MAGFTAPSGYGLPCDIEGDAISQNSQKCRIFHNNAKIRVNTGLHFQLIRF